MECPDFPVPLHASQITETDTNITGTPQVDTQQNYVCDSGYVDDRGIHIQLSECTTRGMWSHTPVSCQGERGTIKYHGYGI